jgi:hypothetical protein
MNTDNRYDHAGRLIYSVWTGSASNAAHSRESTALWHKGDVTIEAFCDAAGKLTRLRQTEHAGPDQLPVRTTESQYDSEGRIVLMRIRAHGGETLN